MFLRKVSINGEELGNSKREKVFLGVFFSKEMLDIIVIGTNEQINKVKLNTPTVIETLYLLLIRTKCTLL